MSAISRREFLRQSLIGTATLHFGVLTARAKTQEKVKIGVIGAGAQG